MKSGRGLCICLHPLVCLFVCHIQYLRQHWPDFDSGERCFLPYRRDPSFTKLGGWYLHYSWEICLLLHCSLLEILVQFSLAYSSLDNTNPHSGKKTHHRIEVTVKSNHWANVTVIFALGATAAFIVDLYCSYFLPGLYSAVERAGYCILLTK